MNTRVWLGALAIGAGMALAGCGGGDDEVAGGGGGGSCPAIADIPGFFAQVAGDYPLSPNGNENGVLATEFDGSPSYTLHVAADGTLTIDGDTRPFVLGIANIKGTEECSHETNIVYTHPAPDNYESLLQFEAGATAPRLFSIYERWVSGSTDLPRVVLTDGNEPDAE